jgi:hypothetical protein
MNHAAPAGALFLFSLGLVSCGGADPPQKAACEVDEAARTVAPAASKGSGSDTLIADFEDPNIINVGSKYENQDGLHVGFYSYDDEYGLEPADWVIVTPGHDSGRAARWHYLDCSIPDVPQATCWGAGTGISFHGCYDASEYGGISLWMKGQGAAFFSLDNPFGDDEKFGGAKSYALPVTFTPDWYQLVVHWDDVHGGLDNGPFDPRYMSGVGFYMDPVNAQAQGIQDFNNFEVIYDDVFFLPK